MQSIKEKLNKIKLVGDSLMENNTIFYLSLILLIASISFILGRLSALEEFNKEEITFLQRSNLATLINSDLVENENTARESISELTTGKYVASKNSDKYHAPWCSGAKRISEENKVWFATKEEAEASGRSPASNCKGI